MDQRARHRNVRQHPGHAVAWRVRHQRSRLGQWAPLLHAINSGGLARFADGGPVGFGVDQRFYPKSSPGISDAEGHENRRSWRDFFRRPVKDGGMGASLKTTFGALAMMAGESGRGLNSKLYDWDVNGPSGGVDQLHDVTKGRGAGRLHRLSDLMTLAMQQHVDWKDRTIQQANFRKEATGPMAFAWNRMLAARTATGALKEGIDKFENPANHQLELLRRMPNIVAMQREAVADGWRPGPAGDGPARRPHPTPPPHRAPDRARRRPARA